MFNIFKKKKTLPKQIDSKFKVNDYVDFWHKDDVYFGTVSRVFKNTNGQICYDVDIAGQCPTTYDNIEEEKIIRKHKR